MPPVVIAAGIAGTGIVAASAISSKATSKAAQATTQAANTTTNAQLEAQKVATTESARQFDIGQANLQPWLKTGGMALDQLAKAYGVSGGAPDFSGFKASPDYQFRFNEGIKGVDAGAAARGSLDSGATRKAEINYAGNLASGEFGAYADRLAALAGVGQTAGTNLANLGQNYATNVGNIATGTASRIGNIGMSAADNLASSYLARGQNYSNTIGNLAGIGSGLITNFNQPSAAPFTPPTTFITPNVRTGLGGGFYG